MLESPLISLQDFSVGFEEMIGPAEQVVRVQVSLAPLEKLVGGINLGQLAVFLFLGALQVGRGDQA